MREFNEEIKSTLAETRVRSTETAYNHITTAVGLFDQYAYSQACFLAITAIEEMGKTRTLQMVQSDLYRDRSPKRIDTKGIQDFLTDHKPKAIRAAASGLSANHGALRRHGRHEESDLNLSSGILLLAKSNQWMDVRGACIYTDVNISGKSVKWPTDEIDAHYAYYFICMALEILAEESDAGFGAVLENILVEDMVTDFNSATSFRRDMFSLLESFMESYQEQFDSAELDFFTNDSRYDDLRDEIRSREVVNHNQKRETLREMIIEDVPDESELDVELSNGFDLEAYQEPIIKQMVDEAMDAPYFTSKSLHPDLKELSEYVNRYVEY